MGSGKRLIPTRLGGKLKTIREGLGLTTEEMVKQLDCPEIPLHRASITQYEKSRREPPLIILLKYSRLSHHPLENIIDDDLDLISPIPTKQ